MHWFLVCGVKGLGVCVCVSVHVYIYIEVYKIHLYISVYVLFYSFFVQGFDFRDSVRVCAGIKASGLQGFGFEVYGSLCLSCVRLVTV